MQVPRSSLFKCEGLKAFPVRKHRCQEFPLTPDRQKVVIWFVLLQPAGGTRSSDSESHTGGRSKLGRDVNDAGHAAESAAGLPADHLPSPALQMALHKIQQAGWVFSLLTFQMAGGDTQLHVVILRNVRHSSVRLTAFGRESVPAAGDPQPLLSCLRPPEAQPSDASGPLAGGLSDCSSQRGQDGSDGP